MTASLTFAYPGRLDLKTGGYGYDRRIVEGLKQLGWQVDLLSLGEGFPFPSAAQLAQAEALLSALPDNALLMVDGLAYGVLDEWAKRESKRLRIVALVHHPLALETGLDEGQRQRFFASEVAALSCASGVVVTSKATARELSESYDVEAGQITVALPGTDPASLIPDRTPNRPPHILSVGSLIERKGHDVLLDALSRIADLDWSAAIIGSRDLDPATTKALEQKILALKLTERVRLAGECGDVRSVMAHADIFALASRYEGDGMVFAEALAEGLPIVACHAGAVPEVVPAAAGILVPADDAAAFADALRTLVSDRSERQTRAKASRLAGAALPGWDETARIISTRLEALQ